ncbi:MULTISPECIES: hypothetical protein [Vibrio]|uniref:Uncharacterized protein n=1 Tax=Vibrio alginolyticus TaxID=663 RepID=A0A7Y0MZE5_VIBAL|nr:MULTISPECIES: hypothetical protein [Vibrio]MDW1971379.1 hypothetical protein [Vibrio sp. 945]MDW2204160.1 hypothetical protein [Vibrio sp. 1636]MDW3641900.1 hypothetical protein [Vibrio sp. 1291-1]NMR76095.1 hypothetical protein [Vibrio alginolyticus]
MAKYQFFCKPNTNRTEFTYLLLGGDTFLQEKEQLLRLGFEVEDDAFYANSAEEAVEKFRSNYTYVIEEYNNSNPLTSITMLLVETYQEVMQKLKSR